MAYELTCEAIRAKVRFSHINMDGVYGSHPWHLTRIERMGLTYVTDIITYDRILLEKQDYGIPNKKGIRGRNPFRKKILNTIPIRVDELEKIIGNWGFIRIRESMDGFLEVKFEAIKVWRIDKDVEKPLPVWLLIRKNLTILMSNIP